ncbi:MAG: VOC family protein [Coriobacteriia bacterium]|nr:VOC family protein [Coriobacteriia bacterium]
MRAKDIFGLHHIGIYVIDREESIKFYEEVLGFHYDFSFEVEANNGFLKIALVRKDNFSIELLQLVDSSEVKAQAEQTWNHFTMYVSDIQKTVERLQADGRVQFEPGGIGVVEKFGKEFINYTFFRGINGERIEIVQAKDLETDEL